jgi:glycosyltransferase involved in cell wall biosynthesis
VEEYERIYFVISSVRFTIITPSFNQVLFLEQTIDSVLSQKEADVEYMVFDGGSTDGSVEIIKKYKQHLTFWESVKDKGQSHAINKGLAMATGEIINWLNSDDYFEPDALQIIQEVFGSKTVNAVCARSNVVMHGKLLFRTSGTDVFPGNIAKTIGWARIDQPETFFRRSAFESVGPLNQSLKYVMDKEWWIRYLLLFGLDGIAKVDKCVVNFRHHAASKSVSQTVGFAKETAQIFYALAMHAGDKKNADFIRTNFESSFQNVEFSFPEIDPTLEKQILNYFLLKKADEFYYQLKLNDAKTILSQIEKENLTQPDRQLLTRLLFRSALPEWFIKLFR